MKTIRPLIAGNWKMHGGAEALEEGRRLAAAVKDSNVSARVALCPPATLISRMATVLSGSSVELGGQDCRAEASGAFTGDVAPEMLVDAGAALVILGHSERRTYHGEDDDAVAAKVGGALRAGLEPIVCVGESLEQRQGGLAVATVAAQLRGSLPPELNARAFAVAYEPVWAIGSGLTPSLDEIEAVHDAIREVLKERFAGWGADVPILYGGSVKPSNAREILNLPAVNGALVGGASLHADEFMAIVDAA